MSNCPNRVGSRAVVTRFNILSGCMSTREPDEGPSSGCRRPASPDGTRREARPDIGLQLLVHRTDRHIGIREPLVGNPRHRRAILLRDAISIHAGVDLATPAPYRALVARMNAIMDQIEAILAKQKK